MNAELVAALEKSASAVPSQRHAGDSELKALESQPGFYLALFGVYRDVNVNNSSRYLALIYLKNAVEQKWRRTNVFSPETKQKFRDDLLHCITERHTAMYPQMVKQLAIIIAGIARTDFPRTWPSLLVDLHTMALLCPNAESLNNVLEVILQTVKRLASARIGPTRVQLEQFAVENLQTYWDMFKSHQSYRALKIVGQLLCNGHPRAHRFQPAQTVFGEMVLALESFIKQQQDKLVIRIGKILTRLAETHPLVYLGFGLDSVRVNRFYLEYLVEYPNTHPEKDVTDRVLVQAMCLTRETTRFLTCEGLPNSKLQLNMRPRTDDDRRELEVQFQTLKAVFQGDILPRLCSSLVSYYFAMTPGDLELWNDCPSEFIVEEAALSPDFSVVLCAELLFSHILKAWPTEVLPLAQQLIEQAVQTGGELGTEAALRALQFGAEVFSVNMDIAQVVGALAPQSSPIIRRRLCRVVGSWIKIRGSEQIQAIGLELVGATLDAEFDVVVKLGALELAAACCYDTSFVPKLFSMVSSKVFQTIYSLLQAPGSATELKLAVLNCLQTIIEGMGPHLNREELQQVLKLLPPLWEQETERSNHHLVQGAVLQTLSELITASGDSQEAVMIGVPLVDIVTDHKQPLSAYLLDEGLTLWKAMLVNSNDVGPLTPLFRHLVDLLEVRTETLDQLLSVLESYIWLDYTVLSPFYTRLFPNLSLFLSEACGLDESLQVMLCLETLLILSSGEQEILAMQQCGLVQWLEQCVLKADNEGADMKTMIEASRAVNVLSLVAIKTAGQGIVDSYSLCPSWLAKLRGISDPRDRKLGCMGVTALLVAHPELFGMHGPQYIDSLAQIVDEIPDSADVGVFYRSTEDRPNCEELRQKTVRESELAVAVGLAAYIKDAAQHIHLNTGDASFYNALVTAGIVH